jgi:hypothetical protein
MANGQINSFDFTVDKSNLYREESFTDLKVASIRRLTPIKPDGSVDKTRKTLYAGQTNLITKEGAVPIKNGIQAKELQQAIKKFPEAMQEALDRLVEEMEKRKQKEEGPRIIVPGR